MLIKSMVGLLRYVFLFQSTTILLHTEGLIDSKLSITASTSSVFLDVFAKKRMLDLHAQRPRKPDKATNNWSQTNSNLWCKHYWVSYVLERAGGIFYGRKKSSSLPKIPKMKGSLIKL